MEHVLEAWRERILAHEREAAGLREGGAPHHEHGHAHGRFGYANRPLNPYRTDDPVLNYLFPCLGADASVLDVGGGAGRFALPLATRARHVCVVEPSADSVEILESRAAEAGLTNITTLNESWEDAEAPPADIVFCSLVLHHVPDAAPFVSKMQAHAKERVVLVEMMETPGAVEIPFYERVYGSAPTPLPGLPDVLIVLWAMGIFPDVAMLAPAPAVLEVDRVAALAHLRRRLSIEEGTGADERLCAAGDDLLEETVDGVIVRGAAVRRQAVVTWAP